MEKINTLVGTSASSATANDAVGTSVAAAQQVLAQPQTHIQTTQPNSGVASQWQQSQQQQQQVVAIELQPGVPPQQVQTQQLHLQPAQQPFTWPHAQPVAATGPLSCDPFAQQLPMSMPIAIPAATPVPQQLLRAQPVGNSPSSMQSSQQSPLVPHNNTMGSAVVASRAGSLRPDALGQLQQPAESPARAAAGFKQRESAIAAAVATAGVDITGSTAPLSLLAAGSNSQRFSAGGVSNKSLSPRASHLTAGVGITPQASVQLTQLSRATSLATAGHTPTGGSKLRVQGRRNTLDSDDTDYSSSDNDDDYEYGEAKIKRTFTRQQRKQRKQQKEEQQLHQQAQQLQQQQLQSAQQLQEQTEQAVQRLQADQTVLTVPVSPQKHGRSEDGSVASAVGTMSSSVAGSVHTIMQPPCAGTSALLGSSPQSIVLSGAYSDLPAVLQQQSSNGSGTVPAAGPTGTTVQGARPAPEGYFAASSAAGMSGPPQQSQATGLLTAALEDRHTSEHPFMQQQQHPQQMGPLDSCAVQCEEAAAKAAAAALTAANGSRGPSASGVPAPGSIKATQSSTGGEASFKDRFVSTSEGAGSGEGKLEGLQTSPSELQAEFQGLSLFDDADDDDDNENEEKESRPFYRRPMVWFHLVAYFLSACLLFVGLGSQFIPAMFVVNKDGIQLFRWMYFFALWPMMWLIVNYVNNKVFAFVEWLYYLEALYALDSVRRNARSLVFMCLVLPWFHICFWVIQCGDGGCNDQQAYRQASGVVWKILVCLTLFSLANFLKSLTTKLLSTHFYRTAHFKKVKLAIEKEYYLLMLSQQRPAKPVETAAPLGALSQLVSYAGGHAGSVVANGSMQVVDKLRRMTLERGDTAAGGTADGSISGDIKSKARASSFSGAELEHSHHKPQGLASKSISFFQTYEQAEPRVHDITATAALAPPPPPQPAATPAADCSAPAQSRLWGVRSARSQPWLQLQAASGGAAAQDASAAGDAQQRAAAGFQAQQLGLSPVRESSIAAHVHLTQNSLKDVQALPQVTSIDTAQHSKQGKVRSGRRWSWWRTRTSQSESLLGTEAARSSEYTIAIAGSPPTVSAASITQQQQVTLRVASQTTAAATDTSSTAAVQRSAASSLRADLQHGSAFAAAAGTAAPEGSPRASMDSKAAAALHRGSAGTRGAGFASQLLSKSPSMAAPKEASGVSDPLLHTLEKVNVLGGKGKQVDAANIKPAEWERLRTGIALKTFTALMKRYQDMSDKEEAKKLREARRFAKGLFYNVKGDAPRPFLIRDDFAPFFPNKEQADQAYAYFDKDNDAQLTIKEMKDSVTAIFKERKNMAASLKDTDSIVKTLEFGIGFVFHFIFAAVYLLVWGLDILKGFSTFSATVLALTFVFGNSVRQIYESMLFLFVEHAFDVGDLLEVEMVSYRVKKIDLMYTVLVKGTGERVYYPTTRLITLPVTNLTRSNTKSEKVVFNLDIGLASKKAREALLECVKEHYEENESDFNTCPSVNFVNLMDPFKVQLQVVWTYNFGADEHKRMSTAKTGLITAINDCLASLDCLQYTLVRSQDTRDVCSKSTAAAAEQVQDMLESGQMQMTAAGVPTVTGVPTTVAAVVGAGGALGLISM